jgi:hypothetical protein
VSAHLASIVRGVLALADENLPTTDISDGVAMLGIAAIRHGSNLLGGELELASANRWSLTRVLGRQITESWLWANALLLDSEAAFDRLMLADGKQQYLRNKGFTKIWDTLESRRPGGLDLRDPSSVPAKGEHVDLGALAEDVQRLREASGLQGGVAVVSYELQYRLESREDVHVTFDLLGRYIDHSKSRGNVLAMPGVDDINDFRGPESLNLDAGLIADVIGVYLHATGQHERQAQVRQQYLSLGNIDTEVPG